MGPAKRSTRSSTKESESEKPNSVQRDGKAKRGCSKVLKKKSVSSSQNIKLDKTTGAASNDRKENKVTRVQKGVKDAKYVSTTKKKKDGDTSEYFDKKEKIEVSRKKHVTSETSVAKPKPDGLGEKKSKKKPVPSCQDIKLEKTTITASKMNDRKENKQTRVPKDVKDTKYVSTAMKKEDGDTSEYFDNEEKTKTSKKKPVTSRRRTDTSVAKSKSDEHGEKKSRKKVENKRAKVNLSTDNTEHSDSDFDTSPSQLGNLKVERISIDSSSSESDFQDVEEAEASTSGYNSKLSTSSTSETSSKKVIDFSQVDHQSFDISMLAKIEGIQLKHQMDSDESEDDSDWEKVEDVPAESPVKSQLPSGPVEITLDAPDIMRKKRKRKGFDMEAWFRRQFNRVERETQLNLHKVHLLCLLARGMIVNKTVCNSEELQAHALSYIPDDLISRPVDKHNIHALSKLIQWFKDWLPIESDLQEAKSSPVTTLIRRMQRHRVASVTELTYICVALLRSMGFNTRLVLSLQPVSHKSNKVVKVKSKIKEAEENEKSENGGIVQLDGPLDGPEMKKKRTTSSVKRHKTVPKKDIDTTENSDISKTPKANTAKNTKVKSSAKEEAGTCNGTKTKKKGDMKGITETVSQKKLLKTNKSSTPESKSSNPVTLKSGKGKRRRSCTATLKANVYTADISDSDSIQEISRQSSSKNKGKGKSSVKKRKIEKDDQYQSAEEISSGSDFEEEIKYQKSPTYTERRKKAAKRKHKIVSSDSDQSVEIVKSKVTKQGCDVWLEVFLVTEDKWICVDCVRARVNQPRNIEQNATKPVKFVVSYDNDGCVKDVTKRYASDWLSHTRKLRVDEEWWKEALDPFRPLNATRDEQEDLKLQAMLLQKPLPVTINEYKNHPLYALKRHLLKFEAIYPDTAVPLGYVKKEPVYARECVHTLHTRETWLKEGRAVRVGERPYKIVKGRKKWNKTYEADEEPACEIFGNWQTELYMPPPAVDGKVPRNEYGNVELFQPWMLPIGTVHLRDVPGLNKVARKLDIDCAPAMIGWDFHSGFNHPMFDGFIVCEEYKDVLLAAWDEEQEIQREREAEKREKRVFNNWKTLIKGLLIKERLKFRFDLQDKPKKEEVTTQKTNKTTKGVPTKQHPKEKANDMTASWPQNRMDDSKPSTSKSKAELFPFEKL